ncbi:MAG: hypothetical protein WC648_01165 [Candidatus Paceibacterota bacterium]|jgi:hypothetical protein
MNTITQYLADREKLFEEQFPQRDIADAVEGWWIKIPDPEAIQSFHRQSLTGLLELLAREAEGMIEVSESHPSKLYMSGRKALASDFANIIRDSLTPTGRE